MSVPADGSVETSLSPTVYDILCPGKSHVRLPQDVSPLTQQLNFHSACDVDDVFKALNSQHHSQYKQCR